MPLNDLDKHYRTFIDSAFLDTLNGLHELPESDAVEVLEFLSGVEALGHLAPLPAFLQEERFEVIREELTYLHRIMQNPQPEQSVIVHADYGREESSGIFNLVNYQIPEQPITRELVRNYLINQFQVKIRTLKILNSTVIPMLAVWKEKQSSIYNVAMAKWMQNEAEGMPKAMQDIIMSGGILTKAIKKEYPDLTKADIQDIIDSVFALPSKLFDKDTQALENVYMVRPMRGSDPASKLQYDALQKINELMKNPEAKEIKDISKSFVAVDKAYQILCKHKQLLKLTSEIANIDEIETQCREYLQQIAKEPIERQKPLAPEIITRLQVFSEQADACLKNEKIEFFKNYFALYFGGTDPEKNNYLKILMDLHFSQNKIRLDDAWIDKLFREKIIIEDQKHEEEKKPDQRITQSAILTLDPYYVNHILLHACVVPPAQWTPNFAFVFNSLVDVLERNDNDQLNATWKQFSYPPEFIAQLKWLGYMYSAHGNDINAEENIANVAANKPAMHFPLLYYPNNLDDFFGYLQIVPENNKINVIQSLQSQFQQLVRSASDFSTLMVPLYSEQRAVCFELLKNKLPQLVNSATDFSTVMARLNLEQKAFIFESLKNKLPQFIREPIDLFFIFCFLTPVQIVACNCDELQAELLHFNSVHTLITIFKNLGSTENQTALLQIFIPHLPRIIQTSADFGRLFNCIDRDQQRDIVCNSLEHQLPKIFQTIDDLRHVFYFLHLDQIYNMCIRLRPLLLMHIKNISNVLYLMEGMNSERRIFFCDGISNLWPQIIRTQYDFSNGCLLLPLPNYKKSEFIRSLQTRLPDFIENTSHFESIFRLLKEEDPELADLLFESLKPKWSMLINTTADFAKLRFLGATQREEIINILLNDRLDKYISERPEKPPSPYPAFFAYTEQQKTDAATALRNGTPLTKEDIGALSEGTLGKTIKAFLKIVSPSTTLKDFLNKKTVFHIISGYPHSRVFAIRPVQEQKQKNLHTTLKEEKHKAQKLTRETLTTILSNYHSSSGKIGDRSKTIKKLRDLTTGGQSDEITAEDIEKALKHSSHRHKLFQGKEEKNNTNTDKIIVELRELVNKK